MSDQTVDTDRLEATLGDLVKAAGAKNLVKGGIENSGTYGSDGPQGGGQGSMSDAGPIDDMMIAKMTAAGIPAGVVNAFAAFMSSDGEEDEEEDDYGKMSAQYTRKSEQSSMDLIKSDPDIADAMDVSPYLDALTTRVAEQIDGLHKSLVKGHQRQNDVNAKLAAAVHQLGMLAKSQSQVINALGSRLGMVERAPVAQPRAVTRAAALEKSMPGEVGGRQAQPLRKSEVASVLTYMNLEKGVRQIDGRPTGELASLVEAGSVLDQTTLGAVQQFLRDNPSEADTAKRYS